MHRIFCPASRGGTSAPALDGTTRSALGALWRGIVLIAVMASLIRAAFSRQLLKKTRQSTSAPKCGQPQGLPLQTQTWRGTKHASIGGTTVNPYGGPSGSTSRSSGGGVGGFCSRQEPRRSPSSSNARTMPLTIKFERQNHASPVVPINRRDNRSPVARAELDSALYRRTSLSYRHSRGPIPRPEVEWGFFRVNPFSNVVRHRSRRSQGNTAL